MAIYHLNVSTGSKSQGKSAKAKAQYITRTGRYSRGKAEVLYSFSGNMPSWAAPHPMEYWQATDIHERNNGVLFREVEFALPVELNQQQRIELAKEFCQKVAGSELPFTMAAHRGKEHNPHCHFLLSERLNDGHCRTPETWFKRAASAEKTPESGGARKADIGSKRKIWLAEIREQWAALANAALKRAGHEARIDHQSLKDQGVDDRLPQIHMGTATVEMEEKGIETDRADRALSISLVNGQLDELKKIESEILHEHRTRSRETSTQPTGRNSRTATAGTEADSRNRSTSRPTGQHGESFQTPPAPAQKAKPARLASRPAVASQPQGGPDMNLSVAEHQELIRIRRHFAQQQAEKARHLSETQKRRASELIDLAEEAERTRKDQRFLDHYFAWGCIDELRQRKQTVETADWKETEGKVAANLLANGANVTDVASLVFDLGLSSTGSPTPPANTVEHLKKLALNSPDLADAMRVAERREKDKEQQRRQSDEDGEKAHPKQCFPQRPGV